MQLKNLSLMAGAIALFLTTTPFAVKAETTESGQRLVAQANQQPPLRLQLTPQQQEQLKQIDINTNNQFERVLTQQQREQIKAAVQAGQAPKEAFAAIKLTPQQKSQLEQIMQSRQKQRAAVLTEEQRKKIQQYQEENMRSRGQQPQPQPKP